MTTSEFVFREFCKFREFLAWRVLVVLCFNLSFVYGITGSIQMNFVGTQMACYVHRPLLNTYAAVRAAFVALHEFSNVVVKPPYDELAVGTPSINPRFSTLEDDCPAFIADTASSISTTMPLPYVSLPLFHYELVIIYNLDNVALQTSSTWQMVLSQEMLIKIFIGQTRFWNQLSDKGAFPGIALSTTQKDILKNKPIILTVIDRPSGYTKMLKDTMFGFTGYQGTCHDWGVHTAMDCKKMLLLLNDDRKSVNPDKYFVDGSDFRLTDRKENPRTLFHPSTYTYHTANPEPGDPFTTAAYACPPPSGPDCNPDDGMAGFKRNKPVRVASPDAVLGYVLNKPWSIGYTSLVNVKVANKAVGVASLTNNAGQVVPASTASLRATVPVNGSVSLDGKGLLNQEAAHTYPMVGMSFVAFRSYSTAMALNGTFDYTAVNCTLAAELLRYYRWVNHSPIAQAKLTELGTVSIPNNTYDQITNSVLRTNYLCTNNSIMAKSGKALPSELVWNAMLVAIANEQNPDYITIICVYVLVPIICLIMVYFIVLAFIGWFILKGKTNKGKYRIRSRDIAFIETSKERYKAMLRTRPFLDNQLDCPFITGEFGSGVVLLRPFDMEFNNAPLRVRQELIHMQEWKTHKNLVKFLGVTEVNRGSYIVSELSLLGDLRTLLSNDSVRITVPVRYCMAKGVAAGLEYLHGQHIVHGNLRSPSIYVESDWSIRISDWEYVHLYSMQGVFVSKDQIFKQMRRASMDLQILFLTPLLWTAPELLKASLEQTRKLPTKEADSYSFGIIFYEILTRLLPYKYDPESRTSPLPFVMRTMSERHPLRPFELNSPEELEQIPDSMQRVMRSCWHVLPYRRITMYGVTTILQKVEAETKRMADLTIVSTDFFIDKQKVQIKNCNSDLKQRVMDLRRAGEDFLTPRVYEKVRAKLPVGPVTSKKAYVLHLTMVDYTDLLDATHGESAVALVERFQTLINQHMSTVKDPNIFRLHTAGDDCTIVVGVPEGGLKYVDTVAVLAFDLLALTWKAVMLDIDTDHIKIRMGIHCGPLIGGVYGNDHKEYTVFGETRDIAEDMERLSDTYRILVSQDFINDLQKYNGFTYILNTDKKRYHEKVTTYWLLGRVKYAEQAALNEINDEYGAITDGRIPTRPEKKPKTQMGSDEPGQPTNRARARRGSFATQDMSNKRPSILERRQAPKDQKRRQSSINHQLLIANHGALLEPRREEPAIFDVVRVDNNQEITIVDFDHEEGDDLITQVPLVGLAVPQGLVKQLSVIPEDVIKQRAIETVASINSAASSQKGSKLSMKRSVGPIMSMEFVQDSEPQSIRLPSPRKSMKLSETVGVAEAMASTNSVVSSKKGSELSMKRPLVPVTSMKFVQDSEEYGNPKKETSSVPTRKASNPDLDVRVLPQQPELTVTAPSHDTLPDVTDASLQPDATVDPAIVYTHSHEIHHMRRRKKRTPHRKSLLSNAETENPAEHLQAQMSTETGWSNNSSFDVAAAVVRPQELVSLSRIPEESLSESRLTANHRQTRQFPAAAQYPTASDTSMTRGPPLQGRGAPVGGSAVPNNTPSTSTDSFQV